MVSDLFASGCLEELTKRGLFPKSRITEYSLEGFGLVVEHEKIPFVIFPYEWSFDMLRDAALAILEVIEVSATFGWGISDLHPYNVLFHSNRPGYVDLGSFVPLAAGTEYEKGVDLHKFVKAFWRPLYLWSLGDAFLAHSSLASVDLYIPDLSWWLYRHSTLRMISPKFSARWARRFDRWARKGAKLLHSIHAISWLPSSLAGYLPVEILTRNPDLLRRKIKRLNQPLPSQWDDYHSPHLKSGELGSTPRFDRVVELVRSLGVESVTELAGNQGLLSMLIASRTEVKNIVCTDYSSSAINRFYHHCRSHRDSIQRCSVQAAVINFMLPEVIPQRAAPSERLQSDLVIALAVMHHLILSQNYHPRNIFPVIAKYTRRYAIIEFMPRGMWTEEKSKPTPSWYTKEWFQEHFIEVFDLMAVEQLEKNRIIFVGRLKGVTDPTAP